METIPLYTQLTAYHFPATAHAVIIHTLPSLSHTHTHRRYLLAIALHRRLPPHHSPYMQHMSTRTQAHAFRKCTLLHTRYLPAVMHQRADTRMARQPVVTPHQSTRPRRPVDQYKSAPAKPASTQPKQHTPPPPNPNEHIHAHTMHTRTRHAHTNNHRHCHD